MEAFQMAVSKYFPWEAPDVSGNRSGFTQINETDVMAS